jgi:hypothetical protein
VPPSIDSSALVAISCYVANEFQNLMMKICEPSGPALSLCIQLRLSRLGADRLTLIHSSRTADMQKSLPVTLSEMHPTMQSCVAF